jgi:hypothetical protein
MQYSKAGKKTFTPITFPFSEISLRKRLLAETPPATMIFSALECFAYAIVFETRLSTIAC